MQETIYVVSGFVGRHKQAEEWFASEERARRRAACLGAVYDSVAIGTRLISDMQRDPTRHATGLGESAV